MHAPRHLPFLGFLLLACTLVVPACAPKPGTAALPIEVPGAFSQTGEQELPARWWTALGDTALNEVIDTALGQNFDLVAAWERLQAAEAVVNRESATLWPDLGANMQAAANFPQPDFVGGENVRLNLQSQYEVDLWGRLHALVDAERFRRKASLADYQAGAITLSAEVALAWYQLAQEAILNAQVETNESILRLLRQRLGLGQVRSVDILWQEQLSPRIIGYVVNIAPGFVPGGFVKKGQMLLQLDPADYENTLALRQKLSRGYCCQWKKPCAAYRGLRKSPPLRRKDPGGSALSW